jgi:hypothetical protein
MSKTRKYEIEDPDITLTWDDASSSRIRSRIGVRKWSRLQWHRGKILWLSS